MYPASAFLELLDGWICFTVRQRKIRCMRVLFCSFRDLSQLEFLFLCPHSRRLPLAAYVVDPNASGTL